MADINQWQFPRNVANNLLGWRADGKGMENYDADDIRSIVDTSTVNIKWFGAVYNVDSAIVGDVNASALTAFLNYCADNKVKGFIPAGDLYLTPVDVTGIAGDLNIECSARIINQAGASATQRLLYLRNDTAGGRIVWKGGRIDMRDSPYSALVVKFETATVHLEEVEGILCSTAYNGNVNGLHFESVRYGRASWDSMHDLYKGDNTQGSIPRCFQSSGWDGEASFCEVFPGKCTDVHGVVLVGNLTGGGVRIYGGILRNVEDNGLYNTGNAAYVEWFDMNLDNALDEPAVNIGSGEVVLYRPIVRNAHNSIRLANCPAIRIFDGRLHFVAGARPFLTGTTNVASGVLEIRRTTIECTPSVRVIEAGTTGTLEEIVDVGNTWIINHDSTVMTGGTTVSVVTMTPGARCRIESDSIWELRDATADIPNGTIIQLSMPTVTELSRWDGPFRNLTGNNGADFRLANARQQKFSFKDKWSHNNIQQEAEVNRGALADAPPREGWGQFIPNAGYWPRGSKVWHTQPAAAGFMGWVCVAAGTPGTWKTFGSIAA